MSYAIIRNAKHKMGAVNGVGRHNEREGKNHSNDKIDDTKTYLNYHIKKPREKSYSKEFYRIKEENGYEGKLMLTGKKQSNVICEFLVASDNKYFDQGNNEMGLQYFDDAYEFICNEYGEKNIVSAVVHMDETTPHMHVSYVPIGKCKKTIKTLTGENKDNGKPIYKKELTYVDGVNCSDVWKGFNSYGTLQDKYYKFIKERGHDMDRGDKVDLNADYTEKKQHVSHLEHKVKTLDKNIQKFNDEISEVEDIMEWVDGFSKGNVQGDKLILSRDEWKIIAQMLMLYAIDKDNVKKRSEILVLGEKTQKMLVKLKKNNPELYKTFADEYSKIDKPKVKSKKISR